jgi:hypothetical protein
MSYIRDFLPDLKAAADQLDASGFHAEAEEIRGLATAFWTTSCEMLGEIGVALVRILRHRGSTLPGPVRATFEAALVEIPKIWPSLQA